VTTERERELALEIAPEARIEVIPNGVDTEYFAPNGDRLKRAGATIAFIGDMSYLPNQQAVSWFARQILPLIQASVPEARFLIIGRNPNRKVRALVRIPGVSVTGFVPDVRTYLGQAQVVVAPFSIAAGIQNKILEAMASGLPVVATARTVQGLAPRVAGAVEVANTAEGLAARVVALLRDPERALRTGTEGRCRVAEDYQWRRSMERLLQVVEDGSDSVTAKARLLTNSATKGAVETNSSYVAGL
jgi:glycosyltransferase involved in cell wall biosynthesis